MRYLLVILAAIQFAAAQGQRRWKSDMEYNHPKAAQFVNDTFVKDISIAVYMKSVPGDSIAKKNLDAPLVINGISYSGTVTLYRNRDFEFLTLDSIRKMYCPNVDGQIIYMVNEHVIMKDAISYRIDRSQIESCNAVLSSDIETLKDRPLFTIVHIFTKEADKPVRLGY